MLYKRFYALLLVSLSFSLFLPVESVAQTLPAVSAATETANAQPAVASPAPAGTTVIVPSAPPQASGTDPAPVFVPAAGATPTPPVEEAMAQPVNPSSPPLPVVAGNLPGGNVPPTDGILKSPETPKIVTDAVARLQQMQPINLDDMIHAQDAINRLDVLLEIEKRQSELKKIRDERNKSSSVATAIPVTALNLPRYTRLPSEDDEPVKAVKKRIPVDDDISGSTVTITRISGIDGNYSAILMVDEKTISVKTGDKLPDGRIVTAITVNGLTLTKGKKTEAVKFDTSNYFVRGSSNN